MKKIELQKISLSAYIIFNFAVIAIMSPLRMLGIFDPGELRNFLLPVFLLIFILSIGIVKAFTPKTKLQVFIFIVLLQSSIVGITNDVSFRDYASHLFQLFSAYIMISIGWYYAKNNILDYSFWKKNIDIVLYTTIIASIIILLLLGQGKIGRLYTPAYNFILVASFVGFYNAFKNILVILGLVISNKRGPTISVLIIYLYYFIDVINLKKIKVPKIKNRNIFIVFLISFVGLIFISTSMISDIEYDLGAAEKAYNITIDRINILFEDDQDLEQVSSGRYSEVEAALQDIGWKNYLYGNGAGWTINVDGNDIHNIHFSPISLTAVFGLPFTLFLYISISYTLFKLFLINKKQQLTVIQKMAPLYILGATVHSFTAYSLFIDLLFFFFIGVALKTLQLRKNYD